MAHQQWDGGCVMVRQASLLWVGAGKPRIQIGYHDGWRKHVN